MRRLGNCCVAGRMTDLSERFARKMPCGTVYQRWKGTQNRDGNQPPKSSILFIIFGFTKVHSNVGISTSGFGSTLKPVDVFASQGDRAPRETHGPRCTFVNLLC